MSGQHTMMTSQHSRRGDASAWVRGWAAGAVATFTVVVPMLGTLTAKINPCGVSGGLPREGDL
jgi:hypothetical protein